MVTMIKKSAIKQQDTKSSDFLGLNDPNVYPQYVTLYNFYIHKYVKLDPSLNLDQTDTHDLP